MKAQHLRIENVLTIKKMVVGYFDPRDMLQYNQHNYCLERPDQCISHILVYALHLWHFQLQSQVRYSSMYAETDFSDTHYAQREIRGIGTKHVQRECIQQATVSTP